MLDRVRAEVEASPQAEEQEQPWVRGWAAVGRVRSRPAAVALRVRCWHDAHAMPLLTTAGPLWLPGRLRLAAPRSAVPALHRAGGGAGAVGRLPHRALAGRRAGHALRLGLRPPHLVLPAAAPGGGQPRLAPCGQPRVGGALQSTGAFHVAHRAHRASRAGCLAAALPLTLLLQAGRLFMPAPPHLPAAAAGQPQGHRGDRAAFGEPPSWVAAGGVRGYLLLRVRHVAPLCHPPHTPPLQMGYAHVGHAVMLWPGGEVEVQMDSSHALGEGLRLPDITPAASAALAAKVRAQHRRMLGAGHRGGPARHIAALLDCSTCTPCTVWCRCLSCCPRPPQRHSAGCCPLWGSRWQWRGRLMRSRQRQRPRQQLRQLCKLRQQRAAPVALQPLRR